MCVYLCVCMSWLCNSDFSKVAKNQALMNAVRAQHGNTSNLIFLNKGLICSLILWRDLPSSNTVVVHSRLSRKQICSQHISLQLGSIQQEQLLTVELHSKQAILANWNICHFVHSVTICVVKHTLSLIYSWYKDLSLANESTTCIIVSTKQTYYTQMS